MKKKIKIEFVDFGKSYDKKNNLIHNILSRHYDVEISSEPEFLFYTIYNCNFLRYKNCIKILYATENCIPNYNQCDYSFGLGRIDYQKRHFRMPVFAQREKLRDMNYFDRKFCNFIYSNPNGAGGKARIEFCKQLQKQRHVDCPGIILNNMKNTITPRKDGNWEEGKRNFIRNYKFTIAFENASAPGYVSEKIVDPLVANSIPIYWGAPDIALDINPKAFINCHDFKNFDEVIEYVKYLDGNEQAYMDMLLAEPILSGIQSSQDGLEEFLCDIVEKGSPVSKEPCDYSVLTLNSFFLHEDTKDAALKDIDKDSPISRNIQRLFDNVPFLYSHPKLLEYFNKVADLGLDKEADNLKLNYEICAGGDEQSRRMWNLFSFLQTMRRKGRGPIRKDQSQIAWYNGFLNSLWPHDCAGLAKTRFGPKDWRGHVMLEPRAPGVIYSSFSLDHSQWCLELANKDFEVFLFSAKTDCTYHQHPKIHYVAQDLAAASRIDGNGVCLADIIASLGHEKRNDLLLQMALEGPEWEILERAPDKNLAQFEQIIVEFRGLADFGQLARRQKIINRLLKTHVAVHLHYTNRTDFMAGYNFLMSDGLEICFARKDLGAFTPSATDFPTALDFPNNGAFPDLFFQPFSQLKGKYFSLPTVCPPHLQERFSTQGLFGMLVSKEGASRPAPSFSEISAPFGLKDKNLLYLLPAGKKELDFQAFPKGQIANAESDGQGFANFKHGDKLCDAVIIPNLFHNLDWCLWGGELDADGDLRLMKLAGDCLEDNGLLFINLPVGRDAIFWPDMRVYGTTGLPRLCGGLNFLGAFNLDAQCFEREAPVYAWFIFSKSGDWLSMPPNANKLQRFEIASLAREKAFDRQFYISQYPDVLSGGMDCISHYVLYGAAENRKPAAWFDGAAFRQRSPILRSTSINPFLYCLRPDLYQAFLPKSV